MPARRATRVTEAREQRCMDAPIGASVQRNPRRKPTRSRIPWVVAGAVPGGFDLDRSSVVTAERKDVRENQGEHCECQQQIDEACLGHGVTSSRAG